MKIIGIIPARFASTRFPGKPLADIMGKPMIQRVYEQAVKSASLSGVVVATDDDPIAKAVKQFGGEVMMTNPGHLSGTDRCNEAAEKLIAGGWRMDAVVNIQGDEPFIQPEQIDMVCSCFSDPEVGIATLAKKIGSAEELFSQSVNKVIVNKFNNAMYFSRSPIPFLQGVSREEWHRTFTYYKHIGIYGYRVGVLKAITALPPSGLEKSESLEQLRWLENGYAIRVLETHLESFSVDTPDDISKFTNMS